MKKAKDQLKKKKDKSGFGLKKFESILVSRMNEQKNDDTGE